MTVVARFEINFNRYLDHEGKPTQSLPPIANDTNRLIDLYKGMVLTRTFDAKAVALQRTGQLGTYPSSLGQEAIGIAIGDTMQADDVLLPTYRETGAMLMRGMKMRDLLIYWSGDENGCISPNQDFPICITIATHTCHAVGVATAFKLKREPRVAVCVLGDGATSKGDFYEAINLAGAWKLPVVFVIANNQWAISVPLSAQTAAQTLAQKAIAAGIEGTQVDGNDMLAIHHAMQQALDKARSGNGPSVVEAMSYRLCDHTTADDARRYRSPEEVSAQWAYEPIARLRNYLAGTGVWTKEREEQLINECAQQVQNAVSEYLANPAPPVTSMFDHLYAKLPASLALQRDVVIKEADGHG